MGYGVGILPQGLTPLAIHRRPSGAEYMGYGVGMLPLPQAFTRLAIDRRPSGAGCNEPMGRLSRMQRTDGPPRPARGFTPGYDRRPYRG